MSWLPPHPIPVIPSEAGNLSSRVGGLPEEERLLTPQTPFGNDESPPWPLRKLSQESHIVLKKHLNVVDAIFQHRQPVDADAERESAHLRRIVIHEAVHRRINHARSKQLNPACAFAFATGSTGLCRAAAAAEYARCVELHRRLGEREITRPETCFHAFPNELLHEIVNRTREIAERNVCV